MTDDETRNGTERKRVLMEVLKIAAIVSVCIFMILSLGFLVQSTIVSGQVREQLLDCTEPEGTCYREGQANTAKLVDSLIESGELSEIATRKVVVLAAVCSEEPGIQAEENKDRRIKMMQACINASLEEDNAQKE